MPTLDVFDKEGLVGIPLKGKQLELLWAAGLSTKEKIRTWLTDTEAEPIKGIGKKAIDNLEIWIGLKDDPGNGIDTETQSKILTMGGADRLPGTDERPPDDTPQPEDELPPAEPVTWICACGNEQQSMQVVGEPDVAPPGWRISGRDVMCLGCAGSYTPEEVQEVENKEAAEAFKNPLQPMGPKVTDLLVMINSDRPEDLDPIEFARDILKDFEISDHETGEGVCHMAADIEAEISKAKKYKKDWSDWLKQLEEARKILRRKEMNYVQAQGEKAIDYETARASWSDYGLKISEVDTDAVPVMLLRDPELFKVVYDPRKKNLAKKIEMDGPIEGISAVADHRIRITLRGRPKLEKKGS